MSGNVTWNVNGWIYYCSGISTNQIACLKYVWTIQNESKTLSLWNWSRLIWISSKICSLNSNYVLFYYEKKLSKEYVPAKELYNKGIRKLLLEFSVFSCAHLCPSKDFWAFWMKLSLLVQWKACTLLPSVLFSER